MTAKLRFTAEERMKTKTWLSNRAKNCIILGNEEAGYVYRDTLNIIKDLEREVERLEKLAYLRIPIPRIFQRRS